MIKLGLTGSIGMGKSTTAQMFRDRGIPVWDADAVVHAQYKRNEAGYEAIKRLYPSAVNETEVDRSALRDIVSRQAGALKDIEAAIHPLVAADRLLFLDQNKTEPVVLFDIPLLFETHADEWLDKVAVVSTSEENQRSRVLDRPGMDETTLDLILGKQVSDTEKRHRADYVISTDSFATAAADVDEILSELMGE